MPVVWCGYEWLGEGACDVVWVGVARGRCLWCGVGMSG